MAITRTQQARQLYRDAGYVQAAYGKSAATPGPVEKPKVTASSNDGDNLQKVVDAVGTASDLNRAKNVLTGGGLKAMIPEPTTMAAMLIINQIMKNKNQNDQSLLTQDYEEVPMMAEGGPVGGEYDFETARQMYGLGKLVKKVTRAAKKVFKSPIGKAAMLYFAPALIPGGASTLGGVFKNMGGLGGLKAGLFGTPSIAGVPDAISGAGKMGILGKLGLTKGAGSMALTGRGITSAITATSLLPLLGLGTGDETEEEAKQLIADNTGLNFDELRPQGAMRFAADGGLMRLGYQEGGDAEPVAKKTMPLLDMDGQEKDYRETGGFVDMGRMERADDVPARLSKNEFVFTADAVRNAGDGSVDKGAEVMYNMMKNLESGGEVSEESQGMEGARRMFQTSQRLEEVI